MVGDVAIGLLALLLGAGDPGGAHEQDGLGGGTSHDVDEVVDGARGVLDQIEQGQEELTVLGEEPGQLPRIKRGSRVRGRDDVVRRTITFNRNELRDRQSPGSKRRLFFAQPEFLGVRRIATACAFERKRLRVATALIPYHRDRSHGRSVNRNRPSNSFPLDLPERVAVNWT